MESTVDGGALTASTRAGSGSPAKAATPDATGPVHRSASPARISAGTTSTQPTCTARKPARAAAVGSRRAHSHRNTSGTTLCRCASTTKWYAGHRSEAAAANASTARAAGRDQPRRPHDSGGEHGVPDHDLGVARGRPHDQRRHPAQHDAAHQRDQQHQEPAAQHAGEPARSRSAVPARCAAPRTRPARARWSPAAPAARGEREGRHGEPSEQADAGQPRGYRHRVSFPAALLVTLAVEVPLYVAALTALRLARPGRAALLAVGVNLLTHPVLWWYLTPRPALGRAGGRGGAGVGCRGRAAVARARPPLVASRRAGGR